MAECSCIRGNYNYYAEAIDKYTIIYQDLSDWMDDDNYVIPETYEVILTPPVSKRGISLMMSVGQINRITSEEIGRIRDGIYCFKVFSCGETYIRSQAIFPNLSCCLKQAWATLDEDKHEKIEEVDRHVKLAKVNAELNNVDLASKELEVARKLLENLKCDCDC